MSETDDPPTIPCYGCDREIRHRRAKKAQVMEHQESGGYTTFQAPFCDRCFHERHGYDCPQCGITHENERDARYCCRRAPEEAPDCPECGRRMEVGAMGYDPMTGSSVTWAACECCPVGWGQFTGFEHTDEEPCKHVDGEVADG